VSRIFDKPPGEVISDSVQKVNFVSSNLLGLEEEEFEYRTKVPLDWNAADVKTFSHWKIIEVPYAHAGAACIL
jgi:hypothetical protein